MTNKDIISGPSGLLLHLDRKSKIEKFKITQEFLSIFPDKTTKINIVSDQDAVAIKRLATSRYLDFPNVIRGKEINGKIDFYTPIPSTLINSILCDEKCRKVYVFLEPWVLRGVIQIDQSLLEQYFWEILKFCDYTAIFYNLEITKSCILNEDKKQKTVVYSITS